MKTTNNHSGDDTNSSPVQTFDAGRVRASVWPNVGGGTSRYKVTITRSYKKGDTWTRSRTFFQNELSAICEVAAKAKRWIERQELAAAQPALVGT